MKAWLITHHGKLQFGLRMTLAALLSYVAGEALGLAQSYWAVLSAVIVIQGSVGGSVRAGINRLIGTVGGAFWGAAVATNLPHIAPAALALALVAAVAPLAVLTAFKPDYRVAPITAIIVLMGTVVLQTDPLSSALERVLEISLGSAIAVAVALFILPARAHGQLARVAGEAAAGMARIVSALAAPEDAGADAEGLMRLQIQLSAKIAQMDLKAAEAKVERANRLADGPDPESLVRTLRRLRHDIALLARALAAPLSQAVPQLEAPLKILLRELAASLAATAEALPAGSGAPSLDDAGAALAVYRAAVEARFGAVEKSGEVERFFALLFIVEQLSKNLQDLADRANELAEERDRKRTK